MKQYGIIGYPLSHSFSPQYFNQKFKEEHLDCHYEAYPISTIEALPELVQSLPNLFGLSVTLPYKTTLIPYLDGISAAAKEINAVNCIKIEAGKLIGHNTDYLGFSASLKSFIGNEKSLQALVLGSGGASKAVCFSLRQMGIPFQIVSRTAINGLRYESIDDAILDAHRLIINTTPLGMFPQLNAAPSLPYSALSKHHFLFDLIYNPDETLFLQHGKQMQAQVKNGYEMLQLQAEAAWQIWTTNTQTIISLK